MNSELALLPDNELSLLNENETTRTVGTVKINRNYDPNSQYDIHDIQKTHVAGGR